MTFRPKPTLRPSAAELAEALAPAVRPFPPATIQVREAATVQVNFRCTPALARLIAEAAREIGSTRRLIARLMADRGYQVPEEDLHPIVYARRLGR